jgi:hypothetical protein
MRASKSCGARVSNANTYPCNRRRGGHLSCDAPDDSRRAFNYFPDLIAQALMRTAS